MYQYSFVRISASREVCLSFDSSQLTNDFIYEKSHKLREILYGYRALIEIQILDCLRPINGLMRNYVAMTSKKENEAYGCRCALSA